MDLQVGRVRKSCAITVVQVDLEMAAHFGKLLFQRLSECVFFESEGATPGLPFLTVCSQTLWRLCSCYAEAM